MTLAIAAALVALTIAAGVIAAARRTLGYRIARGSGWTRRRSLLIGARGMRAGLQARLELVRERRRRGGLSAVERLLEDQAKLRPPDELPQAPEVTRAQRRHLTGRGHPIARKRRTGDWR